jgi:hypothetical protein
MERCILFGCPADGREFRRTHSTLARVRKASRVLASVPLPGDAFVFQQQAEYCRL